MSNHHIKKLWLIRCKLRTPDLKAVWDVKSWKHKANQIFLSQPVSLLFHAHSLNTPIKYFTMWCKPISKIIWEADADKEMLYLLRLGCFHEKHHVAVRVIRLNNIESRSNSMASLHRFIFINVSVLANINGIQMRTEK
jgi:hypothetical protein